MEEKKVFFGKLNSDSGDYALPKNDYLNGRNINIITPEGQNIGAVEAVTGNVLIDDGSNPFGEYRVVGSYTDEPNDRIVYFLAPYSLEYESYIMVYDKTQGRKYVAFSGLFFDGTRLNFSPDVLIHSITMEGSFLFWTDGVNPPMKWNLDRGLKMNNSGYPTDQEPYDYTKLSLKDVYLIKKPPVYPPIISFDWITDFSKSLYGYESPASPQMIAPQPFLFSTRFIYNDGEISVPSPYSIQSLQQSAGVTVRYTDQGEVPFDVKWVELIVKYGNEGVSYVIDRVSADDYPMATFVFSNDRLIEALSDDYVSKDFESVPLLSQTLDSIDNRLVLGGNTDGYDTPEETSLTVSAESEGAKLWSEKTVSNSATVMSPRIRRKTTIRSWSGEGNTVEHTYYHLYVFLPAVDAPAGNLKARKSGYYWNPNIKFNNDGTINVSSWDANYNNPFSEYVFIGKDVLNQEDITNYDFNETISYSELTTPSGSSDIEVSGVPTSGLNDSSWIPFLLGGVNYIYPKNRDIYYKSQSKYSFGVVFNDEFRRKSLVVKGGDLETPKLQFDLSPKDFDSNNYMVRWVDWELSSGDDIPSWATTYSIVRTKSLTHANFVQFKSTDILAAYKNDPPSGLPVSETANYYVQKTSKKVESGGWTFCVGGYAPIEYIAISLKDLNEDEGGYTYNEGDKISIISKKTGLEFNSIPLNVVDVTGGYVVAKLYSNAFYTGGVFGTPEMICPYVEPNDSTYTGDGVDTDKPSNRVYQIPYEYHCEVYTPNNINKNKYYEVSEVYPIVDGEYSVLSGRIRGDVYIDVNNLFFKEVMNPYKFNNWTTDEMRPNISSESFTDLGQVEKSGSFKWSGNFIKGTKVNNLASFNSADEEIVSEKIGAIKKIITVSKVSDYGNVLLVIGETGTLAVYVNENIMTDTEGNESVLQSTKFIGTIRELKGSYGTENPESVATFRGAAYWFDKTSATVVRYSNAGLFPISEYGMKAFFKTITPLITEMQGGIDPYSNEYLLQVPQVNLDNIEYPDDWDGIFNECTDNTVIVGTAFTGTWSGAVCVQKESSYSGTWITPICVQINRSFEGTWSGAVCVQIDRNFYGVWSGAVCVQVEPMFEGTWSSAVCVQVESGSLFSCTWEDQVCVDE